MTMNAQVKRAIGGLLILIFLTSCSMWNAWFGREEVLLGEYVSLQAEEAGEDQRIKWVFAQMPDSSKLLGFLPSDTVALVSFKPDVPGEYDVVLQLMLGEDVEEESYFYEAVVPEDSTLVNLEVPEHLLELLAREDTVAIEEAAVPSYTDEGDQRDYLNKVVTPGTKKRSPAKRAKAVTSKRPSKPNRGNLIPQAAKTYTIQLSSWPSLEEAQKAARSLLNDYGIDAYVQRAFFKDKDEVFYRLRVGNFANHSDAEAYAKEIQSMTSLPAWVDFVRQEM